MNSSVQTFDLILEKYRFKEPVTGADRIAALKQKSVSLRRVLKANGRYSVMYGLVLGLFFRARQTGLRITVIQAKVLFAGLAIAAAAGISGSAYAAIRYFAAPRVEQERLREKNEFDRADGHTTLLGESDRKRMAAGSAISPGFDLVIDDFTGNKPGRETAAHVTALVTDKLVKLKGGAIGRVSEKNRNRSSRLLLLGSVDSFGAAYLIHVKIIDSETTRIVFSASEKAASEDDLERAASSIAGKITVLLH